MCPVGRGKPGGMAAPVLKQAWPLHGSVGSLASGWQVAWSRDLASLAESRAPTFWPNHCGWAGPSPLTPPPAALPGSTSGERGPFPSRRGGAPKVRASLPLASGGCGRGQSVRGGQGISSEHPKEARVGAWGRPAEGDPLAQPRG